MNLREKLPEDVQAAATAAGLNGEPILLCTQTQIDLLGEKRSQWLVLTGQRLLVVGKGEGAPRTLHNIPADQIRDARVAPQVGSGLLQVKTDGLFVDILRFVNSDSSKFSRVAHKLVTMVGGKPVVVTEEDEQDEHVCQSCGRPVGEAETLCPRCVKKGRTILRMVGLMARYWPYAAALLVLVFLMSAMSVVPPRITRTLLDDVLVEGAAEDPELYARCYRGLVAVVLVWVGYHILSYLLSVGSGVLSTFVGTRVTDDMRQRMYRRLQRLSIRYYDRQPVGVLMTRVTSDTAMLCTAPPFLDTEIGQVIRRQVF